MRALLILALIVLSILGAAGYASFGPPSWPEVGVCQPSRGKLEVHFIASGKVTSGEVQVAGEVGGSLQSVFVEKNAPVERGQLLARFDDEKQRAEVESLTSSLQAAISRRDEARHNLAYKSGLISTERSRAAAAHTRAEWELKETRRGALEQEIQHAQSRLEEGEAELEHAGAELARREELYAQDIVSQADVEKARTDQKIARAHRDQARSELEKLRKGTPIEQVEAARAQVAVTQAELRSAEQQTLELPVLEERVRAANMDVAELEARLRSAEAAQGKMVLKAPVAGVVSRRLLDPGEFAHPGEPVLTLTSAGKLWIEADVDERDAAHVTQAQSVTVRFPSRPGEEFRGQVVRLAPTLETPAGSPGGARFLTVRVELPEAPEGLRAGLEVDVEGTRLIAEEALLIPRTALIRDGDTSYVMVVKDGVAERSDIQIGAMTSEAVEVLSGLDPDTLVVVRGQETLSEGGRVRIRS
ncbi:MAG: efflux RND transporter periplasmic adaptor subunit [Armatimonadetes bacterium]|nr:efflux RND transporter periplasmic adaptor subunit [Armatimonadota bacterium]